MLCFLLHLSSLIQLSHDVSRVRSHSPWLRRVGWSCFTNWRKSHFCLWLIPLSWYICSSVRSFNTTSKMRTFDSETALSISEGNDSSNQSHCFHKKCTFRVWKVLVFSFSVVTVIVLLGFLIAMFGPGSKDLKYYPRSKTDGSRRNRGRMIHELTCS